jgi:hypothetical protein
MADQTGATKEAISDVARKEREGIVRSGGTDPGQARQEKIVRESFERSERRQEQRKRR